MGDIKSTLPVTDSADGATGSVVPSNTIQVGGSDGTNLRTLSTDTTGKLINKSQVQDNTGNGITSTTLNSKQRLDVDLYSEGADGATSPVGTLQVGGKDPSGNLQTFNVDTTGALLISERLPLTGAAPTAVSVGITSGSVIAANASRRGLVLTNTSVGIISFNIVGGSAVLRSGITLYPGGHWEMDSFTFTTNAIDGIASVAACNLAIQELT